MTTKQNIASASLALTLCVSTAQAQTNLFTDLFTNVSLQGWLCYNHCGPALVNQQLVLSANFGPLNTNNLLDTVADAYHSIPISGPLSDGQTLELRADLVGVSQNDVMANLQWYDGVLEGYALAKGPNSVGLAKWWNGGTAQAVFFYEQGPVKNQNISLVLAFTRHGSDLAITTRVLDDDNANAVLFERTVTDTPQSDPVLPSGAFRGVVGAADPPGTPWPLINASGQIGFMMWWANSTQGTPGPIEATFDNAEVWQYETPPLVVQRAIVLSWPLTTPAFALEAAPSLGGPWTTLASPWTRTNNGQAQVSVLASDSQQFFRLCFSP